MALPLSETLVRVRVQYDGAPLRQANSDLNSYVARAGQASSLLAARFRNTALAASLAVAGMGKAFADVERAEVNLRRVTNLQAAAFERLAHQVRALAPALGLTEQKALELATTAKRLGIGDDELPKFIATVTRASNALGLQVGTVAENLAHLRASLGLGVTDLDRLTSAVVQLDNASAAAFPEILSSMQRSAGLGKLLGVSGQHLAAFSAALLESGVSAERSGTGLQRLFAALINRRSELSRVVGFDVGALPPQEAVLRVSQSFARLVQTGGDTRSFLQAFGGEGQRVIEVLSKLGGNADRVRHLMSSANEEFVKGGALARIFSAVTGTLSFRFDQLKSSVLAAASAVGKTLAPFLHAVLNAVEGLAKAIQGSKVLQLAVGFGLLGTVIAATAGFLTFFAASQVIAFAVAKNGLPQVARMWRGVGASIRDTTAALVGLEAVGAGGGLGNAIRTGFALRQAARSRRALGLGGLSAEAWAAAPTVSRLIASPLTVLSSGIGVLSRVALPVTLIAAALKAVADNTYGVRDALHRVIAPLQEAFSERSPAGRGLKVLVRVLEAAFGIMSKIAALVLRTFADLAANPLVKLFILFANVVGGVMEQAGRLVGIRPEDGVPGALPRLEPSRSASVVGLDTSGFSVSRGTVININNPVVRGTEDLRRMEEAVERALNRAMSRAAAGVVSS